MSTFTDLQPVIYALADREFPAQKTTTIHDLKDELSVAAIETFVGIRKPKSNDEKTKREKDAEASALATLDELAKRGFLTKAHAARLFLFTKNKPGLFVSFREAGSASLSLINQGYACKGHDILFKSIKQKDGVWTWKLSKDGEEILRKKGAVDGLSDLAGLIGCYDPKLDDPSNPGTDDQKKILYGIMAAASETASEPARRIPLADIDISAIKKARKDREAAENNAETKYTPPKAILSYYTGDYDMHDLRVLTGGREDYLTQSRIVQEMADAMAPERVQQNVSYKKNPRAVLRHGAQTNYASFTLSSEVEPKEVDAVVHKGKQFAISRLDRSAVAMFNHGVCYILESVQNLAKFYSENNLNNGRIPCYYYLQHLYEYYSQQHDKPGAPPAESEDHMIDRQAKLIARFVRTRASEEAELQSSISKCSKIINNKTFSAADVTMILDLINRAQAFLSYLQGRAILSPNS